MQSDELQLETESMVIGAMCFCRDARQYVSQNLKRLDFQNYLNQTLFDWIIKHPDAPTDLMMLTQQLDPIEQYGGASHIAGLSVIGMGIDHEYYCDLIKKRSIQRRFVEFLRCQMNSALKKDTSEIYDLLNSHTDGISQFEREITFNTGKDWLSPADIPVSYDSHKNKLLTHFYNLDQLTGGFGKGNLIILGARPAIGKTAFICNLALQMAASGKKIYMFNLEMSNEQIMCRLMCCNSRKSMQEMEKMEEVEFVEEYKKLEKFPIRFSSSDVSSMLDIQRCIFSACHKMKADLVIVDYIGLIQLNRPRENRNLDISYITSNFKSLAKKYEIPILCLSQLNRFVESRNDRRPMLSDLRDSGSIEQDADLVLFLYRDDYYYPEKNKGIAECIVAKNRHGNTGTVKFKFDRSIGIFEEMI